MTDRIVAAGTLQAGGFPVDHVAIDGRSDRFMTAAARVFSDLVVELRNFNGVRIMAAGEVEGVPEPVVRLHGIFSDRVMRGMAIVTGCDRMMAGLQPGIVLRLHNMTIRAGGRVIGEIGISLGVDESVGAKTYGDPKKKCRRDTNRKGAWHQVRSSE